MTTKTHLPVPRSAAAVVLVAGLAATLGGCGSDSPAGQGSATSTTAPSAATPSAATSTTAPASSSPSSGASSSGSTAPRGRTITVTVTGSRVTPAPGTVDLRVGETITLVVTSDHADQLHVHGFDIERQLPAGRPVSVELTGQSPGVYEVETHEPALTLLTVAVR